MTLAADDARAGSGAGAIAGDTVQSLVRGIAVIRAFDGAHPTLTLSEVAARADIPRAAAGRFLRTLEQLGYVRADARRFTLTPRVLELGFGYLSALTVPEVLQPHLEALSRDVDESVSAAVLDGTGIVYVGRAPTRRIMSVAIAVGTRFPAYATSMGRVLLAALPAAERDAVIAATDLAPLTARTLVDPGELRAELARVADQGYAVVDGELEDGVRSVAVPVHGRAGDVVAAVNVSASAARTTLERLRREHLPRLVEAARGAERDLRLR
ncbi:IclR family transcriptional regulator domain-containing protein [Demequina soli]|uniref:IclR family transcriptional regulator domain-containing protein n=1 Tax=Demequina soli TaxID=1638987 RepID=UPI0007827AD5|nr:IclR family transcriptional regulator C-terminal domain-containing protein [Demequina soli]